MLREEGYAYLWRLMAFVNHVHWHSVSVGYSEKPAGGDVECWVGHKTHGGDCVYVDVVVGRVVELQEANCRRR